jgi:hypothetical protein
MKNSERDVMRLFLTLLLIVLVTNLSYCQPRNFGSCASETLPNHPLFNNVHKIFIKEIASMDCEKPANAILNENSKILIAEASYGKRKVLAVGDPWLYNEDIDHLSLPDGFDNYQVAKNLVSILLNIK